MGKRLLWEVIHVNRLLLVILWINLFISPFHTSDVDECAQDLDDCHENAICIDNFGSFVATCTCQVGYTGDGTLCVGKMRTTVTCMYFECLKSHA